MLKIKVLRIKAVVNVCFMTTTPSLLICLIKQLLKKKKRAEGLKAEVNESAKCIC